MIRITTLLLTFSLIFPAAGNLSFAQEEQKSNIILWHPQVIEYLYVNNTIDETVEYSITVRNQMNESSWTVDGQSVDGKSEGNKYFYIRTWDSGA